MCRMEKEDNGRCGTFLGRFNETRKREQEQLQTKYSHSNKLHLLAFEWREKYKQQTSPSSL